MEKLLADTPRRKAWGKTPIKTVVSCQFCDWTWRPSTGFGLEACPNCKRVRSVKARTYPSKVEKLKTWARPEGYWRDWERKYRRRALILVGRGTIACVRCGCDRPELLEINHKNGGGGKEHKTLTGSFHREVARLKRPVDDLELLCRPCNAVHFLELKFGILPFRVTWQP